MDECEEKLGAMGGEGGRPALSNQKKNVWNKKMISVFCCVLEESGVGPVD